MTMRVSDRGLCEIAAHEGIVPYPYFDSVGTLTIGVGHTVSAGPPDPASLPRGEAIPLAEVFAIFRRDIARFEARVNSAVDVPLFQHEFDALVSFDYNTGGIHRAKLTEHLNRGDREAAAAAFMGWQKPPEIVPRRCKEQALFRDGTYSSNGTATVYKATAAGNVLWGTGERVSVMEALRAPEKPVQPPKAPTGPKHGKNLRKSRTIKGAAMQTAGGGGAVGAEKLGSTINESAGSLLPIVSFSTVLLWVFVTLFFAGLGLTVYARMDDAGMIEKDTD